MKTRLPPLLCATACFALPVASALAETADSLRLHTIDRLQLLASAGPSSLAADKPAKRRGAAAQPAGKEILLAQSDAPRQADAARAALKEELRREILDQLKTEGWAPKSGVAPSAESSQMTISLIQALVQSGIVPKEKADALIADAKRAAAEAVAAQNSGSKVVRVPYVPQTVRNEIKEELRREVLAQAKDEGWAAPAQVPEWVKGMRWETDLRLRFQQDRFDKGNFTPLQLGLVEDPITVANSQDTNNRLRLRLRFGMETDLGDITRVGFRIATGSLTNNPLSTNQTLGNNFDRFAIGVDRAYIKIQPRDWVTLSGGRVANPFFSTDLVWHPVLNFDGVVAASKSKFSETTSGFLTLGAFPLTKIDPSPTTSAKSKWLFGSQVGVEWKGAATGLKVGAALYSYKNVEGVPNAGDFAIDPVAASRTDGTAPSFRQKGNSLVQIQALNNPTPLFGVASKFNELNLTGTLDFAQLAPVHVMLTGDIVKNIGFNRGEILRRTGRDIDPKTLGYQARLTVGKRDMLTRNDWQVFAAYKYLERDAVLDAYTDSDFRMGGTDAKGYILGANWGIDKGTWLGLKWLSADPISGPPLKIDVLQVDLNARF